MRALKPTPKYNLCVKSGDRAARCKKMPAVTRIADAKQIAYRLATRLDLPVGSKITVTLGRQHEGQMYWFHVLHGKVTCTRGGMFGPSCD